MILVDQSLRRSGVFKSELRVVGIFCLMGQLVLALPRALALALLLLGRTFHLILEGQQH
jgi:hypothetical protein